MLKVLVRCCIPLIFVSACGGTASDASSVAAGTGTGSAATSGTSGGTATGNGDGSTASSGGGTSTGAATDPSSATGAGSGTTAGTGTGTANGTGTSTGTGTSSGTGTSTGGGTSGGAGTGGTAGNGAAATPVATGALYVDPTSAPAVWVANNPNDANAADIRSRIASQPIAKWFGGWSGDIGSAVGSYVTAAAAQSQTPSLVAYNIPGRDCGQYSAGGANSLSGYQTWIHDFAAAIGSRSAIVILEPDALPQLDCLSADGQAGRLQVLNYAVTQFKTLAPNALVYLDAGHSNWLAAAEAAKRLAAAGVANAHGFALNVSNYRTDAESATYGSAVSAALQQSGGAAKPFVVDTSRNGNGPLGSEWCDPAGRKIGVTPKRNSTSSAPEMSLWIKVPGDADGCAATAGTFVPALAYKLIYGN